MAGSEKEHDWDKEMAEVDRLLKRLPAADPTSPKHHGYLLQRTRETAGFGIRGFAGSSTGLEPHWRIRAASIGVWLLLLQASSRDPNRYMCHAALKTGLLNLARTRTKQFTGAFECHSQAQVRPRVRFPACRVLDVRLCGLRTPIP